MKYCGEGNGSEGDSAVTVFLNDLRSQKYAAGTLLDWEQHLRGFRRYLETVDVDRFQDVTSEVLQQYQSCLREDGLAPGTIYFRMRTTRKFFAWLESKSLLFENPFTALRLPKRMRSSPRTISVAQMRKLLRVPDTSQPVGLRDRAILEVLYATALQRAEMTALSVSDVDLDNKTIHVHSKRGKERVLPLGKAAARCLTRYLKEARPKLLVSNKTADVSALWITRFGQPFAKRTLWQTIRTHAKTAGLGSHVTAHTLRRSRLTQMLANGAYPLMVAKMAGHANLCTLSEYLRITVTELKTMQHDKKADTK